MGRRKVRKKNTTERRRGMKNTWRGGGKEKQKEMKVKGENEGRRERRRMTGIKKETQKEEVRRDAERGRKINGET